MNPIRRAITISAVALGLGVAAVSGTTSADEVPNEKNWHIHDGLGNGPAFGDHHAPLAFFPALFAQEGLAYGTAEAPYVNPLRHSPPPVASPASGSSTRTDSAAAKSPLPSPLVNDATIPQREALGHGE